MKKYTERSLKNILIVLASLLFSCLFLFTLIMSISAREINEYVIERSDLTKKGEKIYLMEIWVSGAKIDLVPNDMEEINGNNEYIILNNENPKYIFETSAIETVDFVFLKNIEGGVVNISTSTQKFEVDLKDVETYNFPVNVNEIRTLNILKNFFNNYNFHVVYILSLISFLLFYFLLFNLIEIIKKIKYNTFKARHLLFLIFIFSFLYFSGFYFLLEIIGKFILIPIMGFTIGSLFYIKNGTKNNIHNLFAYLGTIFGITFIFFMLPGQVPDEPSHLVRSYVDSYILDDKPIKIENGYYTAKTSGNLESLVGSYCRDVFNFNFKIAPKSFFKYYFLPLDQLKTTNYLNYTNTANLAFLAYFPNALWFGVSRVLNISSFFTFFIGRIINFTIWILLCYYAIRKTPVYKKVFLVVLLLPISIQAAIGFNQDYLHNALFALITAIFLQKIFSKKQLDWKSALVLSSLGLLFSMCKLGYFPVLFLSVLIPLKNFKNQKDKVLKVLLIVVPTLILTGYFIFYKGIGLNSKEGLYSISNLVSKPLILFKLYVKTFFYNTDYMLFRGLINGFGWSTKYHSQFFGTIVAFCSGILLCSSEKDSNRLNIFQKIVIIIIGIVIAAAIYASMIGITPIGYETIEGLQPRYFIPVLLLLSIGFSNKFLNIKTKNLLFVYSIFISVIMTIVFLTLSSYFY